MWRKILMVLMVAFSATQSAAQTRYDSVYYVNGTFLISYAHLAINLKAAQSRGLTGRGINIAVFDTGLDVSNPKFNGNLLRGWNIYGRNGLGEASVTRDNGTHGTMVSSIIAANRTPGLGSNTYGIAPEARIMPIQIFDAQGRAAWTDSQFHTAIREASRGILSTDPKSQQRGIFNNSWNSSQTLADLGNDVRWVRANHEQMLKGWVDAANRNILNVWAAGNFRRPDPGYFATMASIDTRLTSSWIVVVATDRTGHLANYSNACGIAANYCMAAPGSNILGAFTNSSGTQTLATGSGTSYAAPIVSGAAALIWQYFPYLKAWQVQQILFRSADKSGIYADQLIYGQGMLNLTRAFEPIGTLRMAQTTEIEGPSRPIARSFISPGGALDGPLLAALGDRTMMLMDDFGRGYDIKLRATVVRNRPHGDYPDGPGVYGAMETRSGSATYISGAWSGEPLTFASATSPLGMTTTWGQNVMPSLAYGPWANGVLRPRDLVMPGQVGSPYMDLAPNGKNVAAGYDWGWGHTTRIGAFTNQWRQDPLKLDRDPPRMGGANVEHSYRGDGWWISANLGVVIENKTLLGGSSGGEMALGSGGATTGFAGANAGAYLGRGWSAFAGANLGYTRPTGALGSAITGVHPLISGNAYAGVVKTGVLGPSDRFGLVVGLPLGVLAGRIDLQVPTERTEDQVVITNQTIHLKPRINEWTAQMFYDHSVNSSLSWGFGAAARFNSVQQSGGHALTMLSRVRLRF